LLRLLAVDQQPRFRHRLVRVETKDSNSISDHEQRVSIGRFVVGLGAEKKRSYTGHYAKSQPHSDYLTVHVASS
jgi:hypothetical protein